MACWQVEFNVVSETCSVGQTIVAGRLAGAPFISYDLTRCRVEQEFLDVCMAWSSYGSEKVALLAALLTRNEELDRRCFGQSTLCINLFACALHIRKSRGG